MHSHQGKYILYYINHQSINPLTSINHLTSINQTIGINDNMIQHVPDLRKNLISTGKLASEGCISIFTDNGWKVTKGSLVIEEGEKVGTLYLCTGNTDSYLSLASTGVDTKLWHHRIGHMSEKGMQIIHKRIFFLDLKQVDLDLYEHFVYGKHKRVRFLRVRKEKKSERLELVHTDVWGPS
jgi:hypothetical protein